MSSYIEWIRERMGHQRFCSCCQRVRARRRRSCAVAAPLGFWLVGLPGGALELDESLAECVVREVHEETGLEVKPTRLVGLYTSPDYDVTYPNGDEAHQVTCCFECRATDGRLQADKTETLDLAWFPLDQVPPTAPWYAAMAADMAPIWRSAARPPVTSAAARATAISASLFTRCCGPALAMRRGSCRAQRRSSATTPGRFSCSAGATRAMGPARRRDGAGRAN